MLSNINQLSISNQFIFPIQTYKVFANIFLHILEYIHLSLINLCLLFKPIQMHILCSWTNYSGQMSQLYLPAPLCHEHTNSQYRKASS